jgi:hypothetical protein
MAKDEMRKSDRQRLLAETRLLLQELVKNGVSEGTTDAVDTQSSDSESSAHSANVDLKT